MYLLDTHLLLWAALQPERLSQRAAELIGDRSSPLAFSVVSIWEVVIKLARGRFDFAVVPEDFRRNMLALGYREVEVTADHALAVGGLPPIHNDPFDRLLIAQARVEGLTFLTSDILVARYPGAIERV